MAAIKGKPHDYDLARRIVHAAGISDSDLSARAKQTLNRLVLADRERVAQNPDQAPKDPRELWQANSAQQLRRWFGGRCITCAHWQQPSESGPGECSWLERSPSEQIDLPEGVIAKTPATFGCVLWTELDETKDAAKIADRTELAMELKLIDRYPGDKAVTA